MNVDQTWCVVYLIVQHDEYLENVFKLSVESVGSLIVFYFYFFSSLIVIVSQTKLFVSRWNLKSSLVDERRFLTFRWIIIL